ncbi:MAG TPA: SprT family zinc-dependent metalloprotease [Patescibacteria group bacterium]|nr:SprT family zinc-dependent metalloprotease [Patescibacteria group bacterium]
MIDLSEVKIIYERRTSLVLKVLRDGTIQVRAPFFVPKPIINEFVKKHSRMIEKNRERILLSKPKRKKYVNGEKFLYLGNEYQLQVGNYTQIKLEKDKLLFPEALLFRAKKEIENWYVKSAREFIGSYVEQYAKEMKTSFVTISYSDTISKWGSCTHDNRLQFNWRLIMTPVLVVRYVIIHELAHTIEKNHSRAFWSRVAAFNPSYKQQIKWLRDNGNRLVT